VLARIRTILRRAAPRQAPATAAAAPPPPPVPVPAAPDAAGEILRFAGWQLDLVRRELGRAGGETIALTAGEFDLLRVFAQHPNRVLNRAQLLDLVKGREWAAYDRAVDTQVGRLRKKIEDDPATPRLIKTVRGGGYIFATTVETG
jgi:DNA-binding response OmpR family regulator